MTWQSFLGQLCSGYDNVDRARDLPPTEVRVYKTECTYIDFYEGSSSGNYITLP